MDVGGVKVPIQRQRHPKSEKKKKKTGGPCEVTVNNPKKRRGGRAKRRVGTCWLFVNSRPKGIK